MDTLKRDPCELPYYCVKMKKEKLIEDFYLHAEKINISPLGDLIFYHNDQIIHCVHRDEWAHVYRSGKISGNPFYIEWWNGERPYF